MDFRGTVVMVKLHRLGTWITGDYLITVYSLFVQYLLKMISKIRTTLIYSNREPHCYFIEVKKKKKIHFWYGHLLELFYQIFKIEFSRFKVCIILFIRNIIDGKNRVSAIITTSNVKHR